MFSLSQLPWKSMRPPVSLDTEEHLIDAFSTHWVKYVVPVLLYLLIGGIAVFLLLAAQSTQETATAVSLAVYIVGVVVLSIMHHWFFHRILSEGMVDVLITNKRLIYLEDSLWLSDDMHVVALERIRAVEARKHGFFSNLLRFGSLWFDTGGSDIESAIIPLVPHPHRKAKIIMELLELR